MRRYTLGMPAGTTPANSSRRLLHAPPVSGSHGGHSALVAKVIPSSDHCACALLNVYDPPCSAHENAISSAATRFSSNWIHAGVESNPYTALPTPRMSSSPFAYWS